MAFPLFVIVKDAVPVFDVHEPVMDRSAGGGGGGGGEVTQVDISTSEDNEASSGDDNA